MRCDCIKCDYNEDYFCSQPDYVKIDENGECEQMFIRTTIESNEEKENN